MKRQFANRSIIGHALLACLLLALCLSAWAAPSVAEAGMTDVLSTTTSSRVGAAAYQNTVAAYPDIMEMLARNGSIIIPGLEHTCCRVRGQTGFGYDNCGDMVPQGLAGHRLRSL